MNDRTVTLNDGHKMPRMGYGLWQIRSNQVAPLLERALEVGYRHLDTAQAYFNEEAVGSALKHSAVPRESLFITSKLRGRDMGRKNAMRSFQESLDRLQLDYLDLFLIHWPMPAIGRYVETWEALIELQSSGLVKSIGVSNFTEAHVDRIVGATGVTPAVNQIEMHPYFQQHRIRKHHSDMGIHVQSYSPLGSSGAACLRDLIVQKVAKKHGCTAAQAVLRWHLDQSAVPLPRTSDRERLAENFDVWDLKLDAEDLEQMRGLDDPYGNTQPSPDDMNDEF